MSNIFFIKQKIGLNEKIIIISCILQFCLMPFQSSHDFNGKMLLNMKRIYIVIEHHGCGLMSIKEI